MYARVTTTYYPERAGGAVVGRNTRLDFCEAFSLSTLRVGHSTALIGTSSCTCTRSSASVRHGIHGTSVWWTLCPGAPDCRVVESLSTRASQSQSHCGNILYCLHFVSLLAILAARLSKLEGASRDTQVAERLAWQVRRSLPPHRRHIARLAYALGPPTSVRLQERGCCDNGRAKCCNGSQAGSATEGDCVLVRSVGR